MSFHCLYSAAGMLLNELLMSAELSVKDDTPLSIFGHAGCAHLMNVRAKSCAESRPPHPPPSGKKPQIKAITRPSHCTSVSFFLLW